MIKYFKYIVAFIILNGNIFDVSKLNSIFYCVSNINKSSAKVGNVLDVFSFIVSNKTSKFMEWTNPWNMITHVFTKV